MAHENEYHDGMVATLELIWGEGYMAPGGPGNVARMLAGLAPRGKRILDIGSGLGGPALEMAGTHGARVEGIDLEAPLVERAARLAAERGLGGRCRFRTVEPGPLPFEPASFDIVVSSGAMTQAEDKKGLLAEAFRVLRPGGHLSCYDWFRSGEDYSEHMQHWFEMEGLTYAMVTQEAYRDLFIEAGFSDVRSEDATPWYRRKAREEYELMRGPLYPRMVELLGRDQADHFVEDWRSMVVVIDRGEMLQGYCRGRRPRD